MNYATIKKNDIANGVGVRVSLYVSGCRHHCKNCFNPEQWNFDYGQEFNDQVIDEIINDLGHDYISGLSLLGGEPFEPENRDGLIKLLKRFRKEFSDKDVWCYSGFVFEKIYSGEIGENAKEMLSLVDVLVDGKFENELKDISLLFRGSSNQRIIDVKKSIKEKRPVLLDGVWKRSMGESNIYID